MTGMKTEDLRHRSREELVGMAEELGQQLWQARFDNRSQRLQDTDKVRRIRRHRARVNTVAREQELKAAEGAKS